MSDRVPPNIELFLDYAKTPYETGWLTNGGPLVQNLERRLAKLHGVVHCISFSCSFWSLALTLAATKRMGKTEVIMTEETPRFGDIAVLAGLSPKFCKPDSCSPVAIGKLISKSTASVLIASPGANAADLEAFAALGEKHSVTIVLDSTESSTTPFKVQIFNASGITQCFSMRSGQPVCAFEGGYVTTGDAALADKLRKMRSFGFAGQDDIKELGTNAKLNEIHAAMALACIDQLEERRGKEAVP